VALLCVAGTACSTTAPTGNIIFDDPRGTVSLQTISNPSIQANHPINLEPALVAMVLKGVEIQGQELGLQRHVLQKLIEGPSYSVPVFSEDQIRFLTPLLTEGLRTAAPDQRIEYRVQSTRKGSAFESSITETTVGSLYAYGRQLYVTLSQYRYNPIRTNSLRRGNMNWTPNLTPGNTGDRVPDTSGLQNRILLFTPSDDQRSNGFDPPTGGAWTDRFLAVDYQLLEQASRNLATRQAAPQVGGGAAPVGESLVGTSASETQTRSTETLAKQVEALRLELQSVQKQLGNQPTGQESQNQKTTPPSSSQQTAP
jgi:hypothetical protein